MKPGTILNTSWGYDMTINNFCEVLENTGKTVKCIMLKKINLSETASTYSKEREGKPFRLRLKTYPSLPGRIFANGSYPFLVKSNGEEQKRSDSFEAANPEQTSFYENHMD